MTALRTIEEDTKYSCEVRQWCRTERVVNELLNEVLNDGHGYVVALHRLQVRDHLNAVLCLVRISTAPGSECFLAPVCGFTYLRHGTQSGLLSEAISCQRSDFPSDDVD